jgi:hypothetical protein
MLYTAHVAPRAPDTRTTYDEAGIAYVASSPLVDVTVNEDGRANVVVVPDVW